MINLKIKDPAKLAQYIAKVNIDITNTHFCSIDGCVYNDMDYKCDDVCILFGKELKYNRLRGCYLRCKQCLECFEVENE